MLFIADVKESMQAFQNIRSMYEKEALECQAGALADPSSAPINEWVGLIMMSRISNRFNLKAVAEFKAH